MKNIKMTRAPARSFIVRVWNDDESTPAVRGEVENVYTGEKRFFLDYGALLTVIDSWRSEIEAGC